MKKPNNKLNNIECSIMNYKVSFKKKKALVNDSLFQLSRSQITF